MTASATQALITDGVTIFGTAVLAIFGVVLVIGIGYLVFDFFYKTIIQGRTSKISSKIMFLDHAPFTKPYKNYNRLRSQSWNLKNTM